MLAMLVDAAENGDVDMMDLLLDRGAAFDAALERCWAEGNRIAHAFLSERGKKFGLKL